MAASLKKCLSQAGRCPNFDGFTSSPGCFIHSQLTSAWRSPSRSGPCSVPNLTLSVGIVTLSILFVYFLIWLFLTRRFDCFISHGQSFGVFVTLSLPMYYIKSRRLSSSTKAYWTGAIVSTDYLLHLYHTSLISFPSPRLTPRSSGPTGKTENDKLLPPNPVKNPFFGSTKRPYYLLTGRYYYRQVKNQIDLSLSGCRRETVRSSFI